MGNALVAWSGQKRERLARSIVVAAVFLFIFKRGVSLAFTTESERTLLTPPHTLTPIT